MSKPTTHAVIIGINDYADGKITNLRFAEADAKAMHDVLVDPGYGAVPEGQIHLLLNEQATREEVSHALGTELRIKAAPEDLVIVYFAGHGAVEPDDACGEDGLAKYLLTSDSRPDRMFSTAISMDSIRTYFSRIKASRIVFFIDSCYSGDAGGRTFPRPKNVRSLTMSNAFIERLSGKGRIVISACDVNQLALEDPDRGNGLFTHYLVQGLRGGADARQSGKVSVTGLFEYVRNEVSTAARQLNHSMMPVLKGELTGEIVLTRYETATQKKQHEEAEKLKAMEQKAKAALQQGNEAATREHLLAMLQVRKDYAPALKMLKLLQKREQERQEKKEALFRERAQALYALKRNQGLKTAELNQALDLLAKDENTRTELEQEHHELVLELLEGRLSVRNYRLLLGSLGASAIPQAKTPQQPQTQPEPEIAPEPNEPETLVKETTPKPVAPPEAIVPDFPPPKTFAPELAPEVGTGGEVKRPAGDEQEAPTWWRPGLIGAAILVALVLLFNYWPEPSDKSGESATKETPFIASQLEAMFTKESFVRIPAGSFQMGSADKGAGSNEQPVHTVRISKDFYLGKYEVTQAQWKAVMNDNPSRFKGDDLPIEGVSWKDVQNFIVKLNKAVGREAYRLPTEAEWEYACRAGTTTPFNTGENLTTDQANYNGNYPYAGFPTGEYRKETTPVGSFAANAWGLYDMHGNVWEWCSDWYDKSYYQQFAEKTAVDPQDPTSGSYRVMRGGSWSYYAVHCRSADRNGWLPDDRFDGVGFRLVFVP